MKNRDEFTPGVRKALAERVAYHCSFPGCWKQTLGPSEEGPKATATTGRACHIAAAANGRGARRRVPEMEPPERKSIANGIWMCADHADLIDDDEVRFTVPMLQRWRRIAEARASIEHASGRPLDISAGGWTDEPLAADSLALQELGNENYVIGTALEDCCVSLLWGRDVARATRDFLIEVTRNAFTHGGARSVNLEIDASGVRITDDGTHFDLESLAKHPNGGGGSRAVRALSQLRDRKTVIVSRRSENGNECLVSVVHSSERLLEVTPCAVQITRNDIQARQIAADLVVLSSCDTVYLVMPDFICISDVYALKEMIGTSFDGKRLLIVGRDFSMMVWDELRRHFPAHESVDISN